MINVKVKRQREKDSGSAPITLILADDHEVVRDGFVCAFQGRGVNILATAPDGAELVELVQQHQPKVVVADIQMPVMDGIEATAIIKKEFPGIYVMAFTGFNELLLLKDMKRAGATGIAMKNTGNEELLKGIELLSRGEEFYCSYTAKRLMELHIEPMAEGIHFTRREIEVLKLLVQGMSNKIVAAELGIQARTVEWYRAILYKKTGTYSVVQLAVFGAKHGLL